MRGALVALVLLAGCTEVVQPDFEYDILGDADTEPDPLCAEDFSLCGDVLVPSPLDEPVRLLAVALYRNIPPVGPPFSTLLEHEEPDLPIGGRYKVRLNPVIDVGDYYVWVNVYMESGGQFIPANGIDLAGSTDEPLTFDQAPVDFGEFRLSLAEGF